MSLEVTYESLGADGLEEIVNRELSAVVKNLGDPNTDAKKARKLTVEITFKPDADARGGMVKMSYLCKSALAPVKPVSLNAALVISRDGKSTLSINEWGDNPMQAELPITTQANTQTGGKVVAMNGGN